VKAISAMWQLSMIGMMVAVLYAIYIHGPKGGADIGMFVRNIVNGFNGAPAMICPPITTRPRSLAIR
jgi:hypothetical protein